MLPQGIDMIISDEAHHVGKYTLYGKIINQIMPQYHYAFTATATRAEGIAFLKKTCGNHVVSIDIEQLYDDGFLIRPDIYTMKTGLYFNCDDELNSWQKSNFTDEMKNGALKSKIGKHSLRNSMMLSHMSREITDELKRNVYANVLILSYTTAQTELLRKQLIVYENRINMNIIHGKMKAWQKKEYFEWINEHDSTITFATQSFLGEGIDIPKLNMLFLTTPVEGGAKVVQFAGRVLRPSKYKSSVKIYDYEDVIEGVGEHWKIARAKQFAKLKPRFKEGVM
jgi:superfamily II DNA or RNA helicase